MHGAELVERVVRGVDHHGAEEAGIDAVVAGFLVTVVEVHREDGLGEDVGGGADNGLKHALVGVFARALGDLDDEGGLGRDGTLEQAHGLLGVVDIVGADGVFPVSVFEELRGGDDHGREVGTLSAGQKAVTSLLLGGGVIGIPDNRGRAETQKIVDSSRSVPRFRPFAFPRFQIKRLPWRKFKLRLVLLLRHDEVGAELVAPLGDETLDQVAATVLDELLHLFHRNIDFTEFLRELEDLAVVLVGLADVVGVAEFHELAAGVRFALAEERRLGEIGLGLRLADDRVAVLVQLRGARREFPRELAAFLLEERAERPALLRDEVFDQVGLALADEFEDLFGGDRLLAHDAADAEGLLPGAVEHHVGESPVRKVYNTDFYQDNVVDLDGKVSAMLYIGWDLTPLTSLGTPTCQSWAFEPTAMDNDQPNILQTCTVQVHSDKWDCRYLKIINGPDGDPVRFVLWRENQDLTLTRTEWWRVPKP